MAGYVLARSNWTSVDSVSLDLVCDIGIEEKNPSTIAGKEEEDNTDVNLRSITTAPDDPVSIILRCNENENREDPVITLSALRSDEYQIISIQILSSAKHLEFYHREYIGSCQGSRITELENDSVYESNFEFHPSHDEITVKCLKLTDPTELIIYCIQITLSQTKVNASSMGLPFDLNRVRSMIDETSLSSNARQFMNGLQHIQERKRTREGPTEQSHLISLMTMMTGMTTSSSNAKQTFPTPLIPVFNQIKSTLNEEVNTSSTHDNEKSRDEMSRLESRLQTHIDKRFLELQQHIDDRFDRLEEKLSKTLNMPNLENV